MSLLQDPLQSLKQIEWYLTNSEIEQFPGAFEIAAGNLCRQTLEQILFILCFYGGVPKSSYLRPDRRLKTVGVLISSLDRLDSITGKSHWDFAAQRNPRIAKFARKQRTLRKWARELNESSHFSLKFRRINDQWIRKFVVSARQWFDEKDKFLVVSAINEIFSRGAYRAVFASDAEHTPGVLQKVVVTSANIIRRAESLGIESPHRTVTILSASEIPRGPWPRNLVLVQHAVGILLSQQLVTRSGEPIDLRNFRTVISSFTKTPQQRTALKRRLERLGFKIHFTANPVDTPTINS